MLPRPGGWLSRCCAYQGSFRKSSKLVVNSVVHIRESACFSRLCRDNHGCYYTMLPFYFKNRFVPEDSIFVPGLLLRVSGEDTLVIFLTANDQESDQLRGYEVGAVDYITKPFSIGALQRKISAIFAMLEHHNHYIPVLKQMLTKIQEYVIC